MPPAFKLTPDQLETFALRGVVRLRGFYPQADIVRMADRLWDDLGERYSMYRDRPESWTVALPAKFNALRHSGAFRALGSNRLFDLADALLGAGNWDQPELWGRPLVTFPTAVSSLPRPPWHLDIGGTERLDPLPTLRVFTFLEPVRAGGGGTLHVAGSHRLAIDMDREPGGAIRSAWVCDRLRDEHDWFARLLDMPMDALRQLIGVQAMAGPHPVRLEEMTGDPGDLIIMHPAILHGTAHNGLDRPRLMLTEWIARRDGASGRR